MAKKMIFRVLILCLGQAAVHDALSQERSSMELDAYRWKNRLLLVFSSSPDDPNYQSLIKEMQARRMA